VAEEAEAEVEEADRRDRINLVSIETFSQLKKNSTFLDLIRILTFQRSLTEYFLTKHLLIKHLRHSLAIIHEGNFSE